MTAPDPGRRGPPVLPLASGLLALQVASLFALGAFEVSTGTGGTFTWVAALEPVLAGVVLWWWTAVFVRLMRGQDVPDTDGTRRSLQLLYPWLTAVRASLWLLLFLSVLSGTPPEFNPVAFTAVMTLWGGSILAGNAVNGALLRLSAEPGNVALRRRLADWLNTAAALSAGMGVVNIVSIPGLTTLPSLTEQLVYGGAAALDVLATVTALLAVRSTLHQRDPE